MASWKEPGDTQITDTRASALDGSGKSGATAWRLVIRIFKWIGVFIFSGAALVGIAAIIYLLAQGHSTWQGMLATALGFQQNDADRAWQTPEGKELTSAKAQHFFIAVPIARCFQRVDLSDNRAGSVSVALMLGLHPLGYHEWDKGESAGANPAPVLNLNNYQASVLILSDAVSRARMQIAGIVASSKTRMERYQLALIIIGAMTTILISVKSIANEKTRGYVTIGILAIVFSALGTACASINAFYSPSDTYARSERALLQLRQLHTDLSLAVASADDLCKPMDSQAPNDLKTKSLKDFSTRLTEILNGSGAGGTTMQSPTGHSKDSMGTSGGK